MAVSTESKYPKNLNPFFVRFRFPNCLQGSETEIQCRLAKLETDARRIVNTIHEQVREIVKASKGSEGADALIYENDVARQIFGNTEPKPAQLLAVHLVLSSDCDFVVRDRQMDLGGPYYSRPEEEKLLMAKVEEYINNNHEAVDGFRTKMLKSQANDWNDIEKSFIDLLNEFSQYNHLNVNNIFSASPYSGSSLNSGRGAYILYLLTKGLCELDPHEVRRLLESKGLYKPIDPTIKQTGLGASLLSQFLKHDHKKEAEEDIYQDLRNCDSRELIERPCLAIDAASSTEIDDAIEVEIDPSTDTKWLHVYVADPTRIIPFGSDVELKARNLASSIYLPMGRVPMLAHPAARAASLSSTKLNAAMCFSAKIDENDGSIVDFKVKPVILSKVVHMTPETARQTLLSGNGPCLDQLSLLELLSKKRYERRKNDGMVSFTLPYPKIQVDPLTHKVKYFEIADFEKEANDPIRRLVTESMITAGQVAALVAQEAKIVIPYRYHEVSEDTPKHKEPSSIYEAHQLLRTLKASAIDLIPRFHYSMGIFGYAKATSPLRRYFDLLLHYQLYAGLSIHGGCLKKPLSREEMASIVVRPYRHEQYLKRLERASVRYWALMHLQDQLQQSINRGQLFSLDVTFIESYDNFRGVGSLWLPDYATTAIVKTSIPFQLGETKRVYLTAVEPARHTIQIRI